MSSIREARALIDSIGGVHPCFDQQLFKEAT